MFDVDKDGFINREELHALCSAVWRVEDSMKHEDELVTGENMFYECACRCV